MLWQMLGIYPVVTQPVYLITAPWFNNMSMAVGGGKTLRISAEGLTDSSYYVQSLKINGAAWNQSWFSHDDIKDGGTMEFVLGSTPVHWDTGIVPPSPGHLTVNKTF